MSLTFRTSVGDVKVELACADAPKNCENLLMHAASGTYDGTSFHRVLAGFMAQAGDPTGTGKGGEAVHGGFIPDEYADALSHDSRGVVGMAKPAGSSDTNGSQFYITFAPQPHLDRQYTIVGRVLGSDAALAAIEACPVRGRKGKPATDGDRITIGSVVIHANPFAGS